VSSNQTKSYSDDLSMTGDKSTPLGVGDLGDDLTSLDPLAGAGQRRKFNGGSLVLVGVIVMAFGGLVFMRSLSKVNASDGKNSMEDKVKKFLDGRVKPAPGGDQSIVFEIGGSYTERQVPLEGVQRNPFIIPGEDVVLKPDSGPIDRNSAKRLADRKMQFQKAYDKLALKSIIMSANPMASVSNKIVRRGDEITMDPENVTFRITQITADSVSVAAEDAEFGLNENYTLVLKRDM
jgi:hypothetical protein